MTVLQRLRHTVGWCVALAVLPPLTGCSSSLQLRGREAHLVVTADVSGTRITELVVAVSAPDIPQPLVFNIAVQNGMASGVLTVSAGSDRTITVRAFDAAGVETHRGAATLTVREGTNPPLSLTLLPLSGDVSITVTIAGVAVTVSPARDTIVVGGRRLRLAVAVTTSAGQSVNVRVQWSSLDPSVVTVDTGGTLTGRRSGETQIVATYGGVGAAATIRVLAPAEVPPALQLLAGGLTSPIFVAAPPGDTSRLFVVLQGGVVRVVRQGTLLATPFLDASALVSCCGERGLLGLAFHPQFATNGYFFVDYTDVAGNTQVVRYRVSANPDLADPASATGILSQTQPYTNHNGGMLAFGPDGFLYVGLGDGGSGGDPQGNGQNLGTLLGKILRIDVDGGSPYAVPPTNPFVAQSGARPEVWVWGLRNPWRFSFDRTTGELYIGDVGQNSREEIDVEPPATGGRNYGWNLMEGTACYQAGCSSTGLTLPALDYLHSDGCSVTGGYVYRGSRIPMLAGLYVYADYCQGWVRSFRYQNGQATEQRDWPSLRPGGPISSFGEDARGELYVVLYGSAGGVYRIVPLVD